MNRKWLGLIAVYALIMTGLLILTFAGNWTPSGYDYSIEGNTLTIEQGVVEKATKTIDVSDLQAEALHFYVSMSEERQQWRMDVTAIGLILPFLLFLFIPNQRPFQRIISMKWYTTIVIMIAVLYGVYSVTSHAAEISDLQQQVDELLH